MADDNNASSEPYLNPAGLSMVSAGSENKQQVMIKKLGQVISTLVERGLVSQEQVDAIREEVGLGNYY